MHLYFIRHGESEANILHEFSNRGWKHGLTEKGFGQVNVLAENLRGINFTKIYSSPLKRAVKTAELLASLFGLEIETTDGLREFDTGINEGLSDPQSWWRWKTVMDNWLRYQLYESRIPGGESFVDMRKRFFRLINEICSKEDNPLANLILVGHGGLFLCMLPVLLNFQQGQVETLPFPNTGVVIAEVDAQNVVCKDWCGISI